MYALAVASNSKDLEVGARRAIALNIKESNCTGSTFAASAPTVLRPTIIRTVSISHPI